MRKLFTTCKTLMLGGLMLTGLGASAQIAGTEGSYQFPQTIGYGINAKTPGTTEATQIQNAQESYEYWKDNFVTTGCGGDERRVIFDFFSGGRGTTDKLSTVSEGIGYGMLLSAYVGDKDLFDGLWAYYQRFTNGNGVMHFKIHNCSIWDNELGKGEYGANGASDAELDVAMALIVASYQWPGQGDYAGDASDLIRIIREKEFAGSVLKPGDQFGGTNSDNLTAPSYFSPAYYEVFKDFDAGQDNFWDAAISKGYDIIESAQTLSTNGNNNIGLVPDWTTITGGFSARAGQIGYEDGGENFIFDAIRTPFRTGLDALWNGRERAYVYCTNLTDWAYDKFNGGTESMGSKFNMNGDQLNSYHSNTFVGCFAVAGMAARSSSEGTHTDAQYQSYLDRAYTDNENTNPGYGEYFNASFKVMTQFVMLGNFYKPPGGTCETPSLNGGDDVVSLCSGPVTLNAGINADSYDWYKDGESISGSASTLAVSEEGVYNVVTTVGNCSRTDKIEVAPDVLVADFSFVNVPNAIQLTNNSQGAISNNTWNDGTSDFSTDYDAVYSFSTEGTADITLTIDNSSFGCSDVASVTKTVVLGGDGWSADDFNVSDSVIVWIANEVSYEPLPKVKCSSDALTADCPGNPCGLYEITATADAAQYDPFGAQFTDGNTGAPDFTPVGKTIDIDATPFVALRIKASVDCSIGVGLDDGSLTTDRIKIDLVAGQWMEFSGDDILDFSNNRTGWTADDPSTPLDFTTISQIAFFPYEYPTSALAAGETIQIDWIKIGAKGLNAPSFDVARDDAGIQVYNADGETYSSWESEVTSCNETVIVEANSCTASDILWFNGDIQVGSGSELELAPGTYTVKLINEGGSIEDEVVVSGANLMADFTYVRENFQVDFNNQSTGYTSALWNFGDVDSDFNTSTSDLPGHFFEGGAGSYDVLLTVSNEDCGTEESKQVTIDIDCDQQPEDILDGLVSVTEGCDGETAIVTFTTPNFASSTKVFYPGDVEIGEDVEEVSFDITESSNLKIEAYPACTEGGVASSVIVPITLIPTPTSEFTFDDKGPFVYVEPTLLGADTYSWTALGALTSTPDTDTNDDEFFEYASSGAKEICLEVTNACGTAPEFCFDDIDVVITGLSSQVASGELVIFPTVTNNVLTVQLNGTANVTVTDLIGNVVSQSVVADKGTVDVSSLTSGAYVLMIEVEGETVTKRFIKE